MLEIHYVVTLCFERARDVFEEFVSCDHSLNY
jgi:hypothetical protein